MGAVRIFLPPNNNIQLTEANFTFLYHLREISDYLYIQHVTATRLELPDLRIIRGQAFSDEFYSLLAGDNDIGTVFIPKLVEISAGDILLNNMCSLRSINWTDIAPDANNIRILGDCSNSDG